MKTSRLAALAAASFATCAFVSGAAKAQTATADPLTPVGVMTAFPTIVQTGTKPMLTWNIMHPARIGGGGGGGTSGGGGGGGNGNNDGAEELAVVNPPGTIIPTTDSYVTVQIIGSGPTDCRSNTSTKPPTDLRVSLDGAPYDQLFYGTQDNVNSSQKLFIKKVRAGQTVDFGGRYVVNGAWTPFFTTRSAGEGTGLGLAISQGLAERMDGSLVLLDAAAPGAVFRLRLPLADARPAGVP